jgi:hypothetical protein
MPARIHLSHGEPIRVEDSAADVHVALDQASRQRGHSAYLAEIRRDDDAVVLVNPDHVVYLEDVTQSVYERRGVTSA